MTKKKCKTELLYPFSRLLVNDVLTQSTSAEYYKIAKYLPGISIAYHFLTNTFN